MDEAPFNKFHLRVTFFTTGGMFCDGYILGIIGVALTLLVPQMGISALWSGLIGSSALIGTFFGSWILGWITDEIGRKKAFIIDLIAMLILSLLQLFATDVLQLFIIRILLGATIGAEYAIGAAYMSEFLPRKGRGTFLASLNAVWTLGFVLGVAVGILFLILGEGEIWRWMLASSAIPAAIVLFLRWGAPESPRWLINKGYIDEAREVVHQYIGHNVTIDDLLDEQSPESVSESSLKQLFSKKWRKRTAFAGLFWFCQVTPYFALATFAPIILRTINITNENISTLVLNAFQLTGVIVGVWIMDKISRRLFVTTSFAILALPLLYLGIWPNTPALILTLCFSLYLFVTACAGNLEYVYPSELFPTHLRSSGVGMASAISRVGAAAGTFLIPISMDNLGLGPTLLMAAGIAIIGLIISILWAPDTRFLSLEEASNTSDN